SLNDPQQNPHGSLSEHAPCGSLSERSETKRVERAEGETKRRKQLQQLMWDHAGLLRTDEGLTEALGTLRAWRAIAPAPTTLAEHEDANLLLLAEATASAALARTESVGAHHIDHEPALIGA
ncbi:hypothetical protein AB0301_10160, partial [Microbacterium profundi]